MKQFKLFVDYEGETWRVIGASSLGDIWLTIDFSRENVYDRRVDPDFTKFSNWRDKGDWPLSWSDRVALANHYYNAAIPDGAPKCNKYTSRMSDLAVPFHFMGCPEKERQFLLQRKCSSSATTQQNKPSQS
jgi:hypothetical protein